MSISQVVNNLNKYRGFNGKAKACSGNSYNVKAEVPIEYPRGETLRMKVVAGNEMQLRVLHFICSPNGTILPMTKNFKEEYKSRQFNKIDEFTLAKLEEYIKQRKPRNEMADLLSGEYNWLAYCGSYKATYGVSKFVNFYYLRAEDVIARLGGVSSEEIEAEALAGIKVHAGQIAGQIARRKRAIEKGHYDIYTTAYLTRNMFATYNESNTEKLQEKYSLEGWTDWSVLYTIMDFSTARALSRTDGLSPIEKQKDEVEAKPKVTLIKRKREKKIRETKSVSKGYAPKDPYELIFSKIDSFFGYYDQCVWRVEASEFETPQNVAVQFKYGSDKKDYEKVANILKNMGAKYIKIKPTYRRIVCKLDLSVFEKEIEDIKNKNREAYEKAMSAIDIDKFKPNQAILDKLKAYRDKGSRVNVKAIKDINKLLIYYYGGAIIDWKSLCYDIRNTELGTGYGGEMDAIDARVKAEATQADTRDAFARKKELPSSANGLFTFEKEGQGCWLPKKILMYFVDNQIPVHFGKVTGGAQYDHNGCQWSEVEHLTAYPNTSKEKKIDIVTHTNEGNDIRTYTIPGYTGVRVPAQEIVDTLRRIF